MSLTYPSLTKFLFTSTSAASSCPRQQKFMWIQVRSFSWHSWINKCGCFGSMVNEKLLKIMIKHCIKAALSHCNIKIKQNNYLTYLSISIKFSFPSSWQISPSISKHIQHCYKVSIMLISIKCMSISSYFGNHMFYRSISIV